MTDKIKLRFMIIVLKFVQIWAINVEHSELSGLIIDANNLKSDIEKGIGGVVMDKNKIYQKAMNKFGFEAQSMMLMEECAELIQAVSKLHRTGNPNKMYEEIADVEIMIEQIKEFYGEVGGNIIESHKKDKLNRLEDLINNAENS